MLNLSSAGADGSAREIHMCFEKLVFGLVATLVASTSAGCANAQIDDRANRKIAEIRADRTDMIMIPSCGPNATIGSDCGLLTDRVAMPDFRASFREKKCVGDTQEACDEKLDRAFGAWLLQRYTLADARLVEVSCDANPGECDAPAQYERMLLASHNQAVLDLTARRENDVEEQRAEEHAIDDARRAALAAGVVTTGAILAARPRFHRFRF